MMGYSKWIFAAICLCLCLPLQAADTLKVDGSRVLSNTSRHPIGIDLNYLRDDNHNRPAARPLQQALKEMGVKYLRYPGGEKSDYYQWSKPPYTAPDPQVFPRSDLDYRQFAAGHDLLDFDEFIAYAREVGAEPYVVVGASPFEGYAPAGPLSRQQYLESAVAWVRYANVVKKYGVKYWEIGNENWLHPIGDGAWIAGLATEFSRAMKAVDPSILICVSGADNRLFLEKAAKEVDRLTVSNYNGHTWEGFQADDHYDLIGWGWGAGNAIGTYAPASEKSRLKVVLAEMNSTDIQGAWTMVNNTGHALALLDMYGQMLLDDKIDFGMFWNTRWMSDKGVDLWYALDSANQLLPTGRAIAIWGQFLMDEMVSADRLNRIAAYATRDSAQSELNIILINKDAVPRSFALDLNSRDYATADVFQFTSTGQDDENPIWAKTQTLSVNGNLLDISMPAVSAMVIALKARITAVRETAPTKGISFTGLSGIGESRIRISYQTGAALEEVRLDIYDAGGKRLRTAREQRVPAGTRTLWVDRNGGSEGRLTQGRYLMRLRSGSFTATRVIILGPD